jgi:hypothetical protein
VLVVVVAVRCVSAAVVDVVDVVAMRDGHVAATFTMHMRMIDVFVVNRLGHRFLTAVSSRLCLLSVLAHAHFTTGS